MATVWRGIPPGTHQIHIHTVHSVGPPGANGTQQFPKLTDTELMCILRPLIREKIIDKYYTGGSKERNAQIILANLKDIVACTEEIFCCVEKEHGYCSCECLRAIHHNQVAAGHQCDLVFRALMICFTFADLQIQLKCSKQKHAPDPADSTAVTTVPKPEYHKDFVDPANRVFHQNSLNPKTGAHNIEDILDRLDKLQEENEWLRQMILKQFA